MGIQPITEVSHNQAILALLAERQELLLYRERFPKLEQRIQELEAIVEKQKKALEGDGI